MSSSFLLHQLRETERDPFQSIISEYSNLLKHVGFRELTTELYIGVARYKLRRLRHWMAVR